MSISHEDVTEAGSLLKDIPKFSSDVIRVIQPLLERIQEGELDMSKGISFLDVKCHMLLSYLQNVCYVIMRKLIGERLKNDPAIERLIELRVVIEKMKPIEQKLKYQMEKLVTTASTGNIDADDPLQFKARPDSLISQFVDEESGENDSDEEKPTAKSNVYVPPKISANYFEEDDTLQIRKEKILDRAKKKALNSSILQELRKEYDTGPEEIKEISDVYKQKINEEMKDRIRYEEEYMMRLPQTKKDKHEARRVTTISSLANLTKFDDISALELRPEEMLTHRKRSSKKFPVKRGKAKAKKKSIKRKRH